MEISSFILAPVSTVILDQHNKICVQKKWLTSLITIEKCHKLFPLKSEMTQGYLFCHLFIKIMLKPMGQGEEIKLIKIEKERVK